MTRKQAVKKLEAFIECMDHSISGKCWDYGYDCANCKLSSKQGNKSELIEYLKISLDALKQVIASEDFAKTGSLDSFNKTILLEKVMQAKRQNNLLYNKYNKFYLLSLENYYNDVNDILSNLIKEFDKK